MASRYYKRATHRPPTPASMRGLNAALRALYSAEPMTPEEAAAFEHQVQLVPYRKRQGDLLLVLPEPDSR